MAFEFTEAVWTVSVKFILHGWTGNGILFKEINGERKEYPACGAEKMIRYAERTI